HHTSSRTSQTNTRTGRTLRVTARLATSMAITETSTGIPSRRSLTKLIGDDSLKAKSHAPRSRFITLCHCRVESKKTESASREVLAIIDDDHCRRRQLRLHRDPSMATIGLCTG